MRTNWISGSRVIGNNWANAHNGHLYSGGCENYAQFVATGTEQIWGGLVAEAAECAADRPITMAAPAADLTGQ